MILLKVMVYLYQCQGLLCIGHLKRARQKKEVSAEQAIKDLEVSCKNNDIIFYLDVCRNFMSKLINICNCSGG